MKKLSYLLTLLLSFGASAFSASAHSSEESPRAEEQLPLEELRNFVQAFEQIKSAYVEEIDDKTLLESAIEGLLASLDPHSTYLNEDSFVDLQEKASGTFGGLGIEIAMESGYVKVVSPIDDTPAQRAGIMAGDLIMKIDDQLVQGMTLQEAINLMRGDVGEPIELQILRHNADKPLVFELVRDMIEVRSVRWRELEPGYGYIRIAQFQENTGTQFLKAVDELKEESDLQGIVLDLRNNPGGVLTAALEVSDALLDDGKIVYTEGRIPSAKATYRASPGDVLQALPIVVLINGGSASASEIVSGALQDQRRAIIAGTRSFGKGSVQTVLPLDEERGIKLTTARYFTPSGRSIQAQGIEPDIEIRPAEIRLLDDPGFIKESDLSGHLENQQEDESSEDRGDPPLEDNQLFDALNVLKGVVLHDLRNSAIETPESDENSEKAATSEK
ncbi:MAG: S41 family peptidase [bacterium]